MDVFGKLVWKEMCRRSGEGGYTHPLEHYADDILPIGTKTLKRRLCDSSLWLMHELVVLQSDFKSDVVPNYINGKFTEATNS
jgi:hypothetical protein